MRVLSLSVIMLLSVLSVPLFAQEQAWTKTLKERAERGTLHDTLQNVRGDSGRWNDTPDFQHAPPISQKPVNMPLDDWFEQVLETRSSLTGADDNWLLFRTRQLDDNDRVWVERIERHGNQFTIVGSEAVWHGKYSKNFTSYTVVGVNLGQLEPGSYEARCIIQPLLFDKFEDPGTPKDNWPKDERPADTEPIELHVAFDVVAKAP